MVFTTDTMPIQENQSVLKQFTIAENFKADSVQHLNHSNCQSDLAMNNAEIENINDRQVFSELLDNAINISYAHGASPFVGVKDFIFWGLLIDVEAIWERR